MLTNDDKKEILELYSRGYSHRKIAHITGHSETTVRNVINNASHAVTKLRDNSLEADQIAKKLDFPPAFADITLKKREEKQNEEIKAEVEAEGTAEKIESLKKLNLKAELSEFQKKQEIEQRKEFIRSGAIDLINSLRDVENEYKKDNVFDEAYDMRQQLIKNELEDFVLVKAGEIDSIEAVSDLEHISKEIFEKGRALLDEYDAKAERLRKVRIDRDKARSNKLLDQKIDIPLFPQFVKKQIKERLAVKTEQKADIVADALYWIALLIRRDSRDNPAVARKMWRRFSKIIEELGWSYLEGMAAKYREDYERARVSINICPRCEGNLIRSETEDKVIISCPRCGKLW